MNATRTTDTKPIIAVDVDEVLTPLVPHLLQFYNKKHNDCIQFEHFNSYQFWKVWGGTQDNASKLVNEFITTAEFLNQRPIAHSQEVLNALKSHYDFVVVTSRQHFLRDHTQQFMDMFFPGVFTELKMGNHYGEHGEKKTKAELCKEAGACLLIDDSVDYVQHVALHGIKAILFGDYPWNKCDDLHASVRRVKDWREVPVAIEELLHKQ
jgi:5'(3')-deoxyribonucleotidase